MQDLTDFLPLHTNFATGHIDGLRNEISDAGSHCIGQIVQDLHSEIATDNGQAIHGVDRSVIELQFRSGNTVSTTLAHAGEAMLLSEPIHPQPVLEDGFATERICLTHVAPWSAVIGSALEVIDVALTLRTSRYFISGFLFHFSTGQTIGFENRPEDQARLTFDPGWLRSDRVLARWLSARSVS